MQLKSILLTWRLVLLCLLPIPAGAQAAVNVLVSILPQKYFAERIGGDQVRVTVLIAPGTEPENFEPGIQQLKQAGQADIFWRIGLPFEDQLGRRMLSDRPGVALLDARDGLRLREMESIAIVLADNEEAAAHDDHAHTGADPHLWLSPRNVKHMGQALMQTLARRDPQHAEYFAANYRRFAAELDELDARIKDLFAGLEQRRFMVFHPAWGYFADDYGLRQLPIEVEGKSPGPKTLAAVIRIARAENIRVIFVQRQFSRRDADIVAQAIDGSVVVVDPLAEDYSRNLLQVARAFAEAMR
jgi:zinc transport system substrate-binding protein